MCIRDRYEVVRLTLDTSTKLMLRAVCCSLRRMATSEIRSWTINITGTTDNTWSDGQTASWFDKQLASIPASFHSLESLSLHTSAQYREVQHVGDAAVTALVKLEKLKHLDVSWTDLSDRQLIDLTNGLGRLRSVDLSWCSSLSDVGVEALASSCHELNRISLAGCKRLTDASVELLGTHLRGLESIDLRSLENVSGVGILFLLASATALRHLDISGCNLNHFSQGVARQLCIDCSLLCQMVQSY
eukprot:TRINITY_DN13056_c0_g1_i2.p1 TRINITY_DN13056_c0_g1~~TRINITY_DN13056_c0_g1_i2.p1  ORF type:complete len:245 (-),score=33.38 TRINITY_DN13056_c0_g1_i2:123-857(-)